MVDPANFRRINPNYSVSTIKAEDPDLLPDENCDSHSEKEEGQHTDDETDENQFDQFAVKKKDIRKTRKKLLKDSDDDELYIVEVDAEEKGNEIKNVDNENVIAEDEFTDEDYLIASPVVLGFSFGHKMWMEFDMAGLNEIQWNEGAFDSLVIPEDQKQVVKALVESHSYSASTNIDDVIQGKLPCLETIRILLTDHLLHRQGPRPRSRPSRPPRHRKDSHSRRYCRATEEAPLHGLRWRTWYQRW